MELLVGIRGAKRWVDAFITELQGKYLPFKYKGNDMHIQVGVKPIQLYMISFPEEHRDLMLNTILGNEPKGDKKYGKFQKYLAILRKAIGLKPIPEYDQSKAMPITRQHIDFIPIGLKEDKIHNEPDGSYEGL